MNLRPLGDRVLVEWEERPKTTAAGIYIPDSAQKLPEQGVVIAIGRGRITDDKAIVSLEVKVGDKVLFNRLVGVGVAAMEDNKLLLLKEEDIYAVIED